LFELKDVLSKPLAKLFNYSLKSGKLPQDWKNANISPLFKKGSKTDSKNYRPISLTSVVCKILESLIKDNICNHLHEHKLIKDTQHGFSRGRSCLTNLLSFFETVTQWVDKGDPVDIIYLDFAKAFDKVSHTHLVNKLLSHGISGNVLIWINEWLSNRKQRVCINKVFSEWASVYSGVPQGSVLGPLLFLIFINDIDYKLKSKLCKFADDSKLGNKCKTKNEVDELQNDLNEIFNWCNKWDMELNFDKCAVLHVGRTNANNDYMLNNSKIKTVVSEKDLGVLVDDNLKFSEHCADAVKQANSVLGIIKRNIKYKTKDVIIRLYKTLVRPKLEYCVQLWCPHLKQDINKLENVQKRALRLIPAYKDLSYELILNNTNLITLEKRRLRGDLIEVFKLVRGICDVNVEEFFTYSVTNNLRGHKYKLLKERSRLDVRKYFFSQRVITAWNKLPCQVVNAVNLNDFKNKLDKCNY
jgi:hypothetical protein